MSAKWSSWWVAGVIIGAPLLLFWPLWAGGRVLYWGTPLLQFYEWRSLVVEAYRSGHFPLWTQALGNGFPLLANLQSAALYAPNLLYFFVPAEHGMGYSVLLHVMLAGFFMYGFARSLGLGRTAGLVSALSYMLGGYFIGRVQFIGMANAIPWFPLWLWLGGRVMRERRAADVVLLGLGIAAPFLAGNAQLWYYGLWFLGLYVLYLGLTQTPIGARVLTSWGLMAVALVIGLLAAAAQLLPTAELAGLSQRSTGADLDFAMTYSFWPWRLITLLAPNFFGSPAQGDYWGYANYWEDCAYIGVLPFLLALLSIAIWWRRRREAGHGTLDLVPFFAVFSMVALVLAMGRFLPLFPLVFHYLPGFSFFQAPARLMLGYTLGMAVLAGIGVENLTASERWATLSRYLLAIALSVLAVLIAARWLLPPLPETTFVSALGQLAILMVGAGLLLLLRTRWPEGPRRRAWNACVVGFVAADLLIFGWPLNPTAEPSVYRAPTAIGSYLRGQADSSPPFRIFSFERYNYDVMFEQYFRFNAFGPPGSRTLHDLRESLIPNLPALERIDSANNYDPLHIGRYQDLIAALGDEPGPSAPRLLGLMNVRYLVDDRPVDDFPPVYTQGPTIYENTAVLPRAAIVYQARAVASPAGQLAVLSSPDFDPTQEVILPEPQTKLPSPREGEGEPVPIGERGEVASLSYEPNRVTMQVYLQRPGYLVLADTYYPGWQALVDGAERPILQANYAFQAVALPAGRHEVELQYGPASFRTGLLISAVTWGGAVIAWVWLRRKKTSATTDERR